MNVDRVHIKEVKDKIDQGIVIKKKRERSVVKNGNLFYKTWVPDWTQGDITLHAIDSGFYCQDNAAALQALIYDETGERGYITTEGATAGSTWEEFRIFTTQEQRKNLMSCILTRAINCDGMYTDLYPTNVVKLGEKLSLIDYDSFNSFSFLFDKKRAWYEKFDLDAWWKPHETAVRDTNKYYSEYFEKCLGTKLDFEIDSVESIEKMMSLLR